MKQYMEVRQYMEIGDQFVVHGKTYKTVKELTPDSCTGCAFDSSFLCVNDGEIEKATCFCSDNNVIFIEMNEGGEE